MASYDPSSLEAKWQSFWQHQEVFRAVPGEGTKFYVYNPAPYVTGSLHMGHVRNYAYGDFLSKLERLRGHPVLYTIGFDAFGVPTEVAASKRRVDPALWTQQCIAEMKTQLVRLGLGCDWSRSFSTADPDYYRWTQWIFVEMFREGLVYEAEGETLWCPDCEVVLAKSQSREGRCLECATLVETRLTRQWFLRISQYLDRLRTDLPLVRDLNGQARAGQESLLACRDVSELRLELRGDERSNGDRGQCAGTIRAALESKDDWARDLVLAVHEEDWATRGLLGVTHDRECSSIAVEPASGRAFPIVIDPRLEPFYLDTPRLLPLPLGAETEERCRSHRRTHPEVEHSSPMPVSSPLRLYRQKDFSISRQRIWGTPIPIVRCARCGPQPVRVSDLPVLLTPVEANGKQGLRRLERDRGTRACSSCGAVGPLDDQVMDCHFDALWHYCRPCVPSAEQLPFEHAELRYWMPVDQIQFGRDTIPFLLTMRLFTKFLQDRGFVGETEFARETMAHGLILKNNHKMSKHLGNVVDPLETIERFGADSLRFYVIAKAEPKSDYRWSDGSIGRYHDLLRSFFEDFALEAVERRREETEQPRRPEKASRYLEIFLSKALREIDVLIPSAEAGRFDIYARAVSRLLESLHHYKSRLYAAAEPVERAAWWEAARQTVVYLAPIAPHLAEECWERSGGAGSIFQHANWPVAGRAALIERLETSRTDRRHSGTNHPPSPPRVEHRNPKEELRDECGTASRIR